MKKVKHVSTILGSLIVVIIMTTIAVGFIIQVNEKMQQDCFKQLEGETIDLADDLKERINSDTSILNTMAMFLSNNNDMTDDEMISIMKTFDDQSSYVSYVEILRPDNTLLLDNGTIIDAAGKLDFASEVEKGQYVSKKTEGIYDPDDLVVRNVVPVIKNGECSCILYGIVSLSDMQKKFGTHIYEGNAQIFLIDGSTDEFMLDSWHSRLGNLSDFQDREYTSGCSFAQLKNNINTGTSGDCSLISKTIKEKILIHYEPVEVNNWMVLVMIPESDGFKSNNVVKHMLLVMSLLEGLILIIYVIFIFRRQEKYVRLIKKMGEEDETTKLLNRNVYEYRIKQNENHTFNRIACVYADVNGLHEINNQYGHAAGDKMLQTVADSLKQFFTYTDIHRVGGDEFVVFCENATKDVCEGKIESVARLVEQRDYYVSFGIGYRENEVGLERVIKEADQEMLNHKMAFYKKHGRSIR